MSELADHYDVVVIGSGFGGSVSASTLVDGGANVLLVERGPWRDTQAVRDAGLSGRAPFPYGLKFITHLLSRMATPLTNWRISRRGLFDFHFSPDMSILCANGLGGGSQVYSGMNVRPESSDFWDDHAANVNAEDMEVHYAWMIDKMGARAPTADDSVPNSTISRFADSEAFIADDRVEQPAMSVRMDGNHADYRNNSFLGNRNGAKATLDRVMLLPAMEKGLTVAAMHESRAIIKQSTGEYLLELYDHDASCRRYVRADRVVLAAGTLNTMKLLFRSRSMGGLKGMPALGAGFGGNGDMPGYWSTNDVDAIHGHGTPCHGRFALKDPQTGLPEDRPDLTLYGFNGIDDTPIPKFIRKHLNQNLLLVGMGADNANGVLEWRRGNLKVRYLRQNNPVLSRIFNTFDEIARRSNKPVHYSQKWLLTVHPLGGARLSDDVETGVVNSDGEVHDNPGVFVADAAALPAAPGAPPSMTISAWSRHVALRILSKTNLSAES